MILGSGFKVDGARNGCVILYTADEPAGPWKYKGIIASGDCQLGRVWECPALVQVRNCRLAAQLIVLWCAQSDTRERSQMHSPEYAFQRAHFGSQGNEVVMSSYLCPDGAAAHKW
jgi:sucrose-6-phosphate hydrolase SacC (GH32 family)